MRTCTWSVIAFVALVATKAAQFDLNGPNAALTIAGTLPSADPLHDVNVVAPGGTLSMVPGTITVTWQNGDYFSTTPFGTVACTIDCTTGNVVLDYTGYTAGVPPTEGLIGVSAGSTLATVTAHELAIGGFVNPFVSVPGTIDTVFQNFDGSGSPAVPAEALDLAGLTLFFTNTTGSDYSLF